MSFSTSEQVYYDNISDEQDLNCWIVQYEGDQGLEVAEALEECCLGVFAKLREEHWKGSFTVFMGDNPRGGPTEKYIFLGVKQTDFYAVHEWFEKFLAARFPSMGRAWCSRKSPDQVIADPRFRYTPENVKDYRPEGMELIGTPNNDIFLPNVVYWGLGPGGATDEYNDSK